MQQSQGWTFLSNHAHVLLCLATEGDVRLRDVASRVGITERAVQSIVSDLEERGAITRMRDGRRNRYVIHGEAKFRHPVEAHCTVSDLVDMVRRNKHQAAEASVEEPRKYLE